MRKASAAFCGSQIRGRRASAHAAPSTLLCGCMHSRVLSRGIHVTILDWLDWTLACTVACNVAAAFTSPFWTGWTGLSSENCLNRYPLQKNGRKLQMPGAPAHPRTRNNEARCRTQRRCAAARKVKVGVGPLSARKIAVCPTIETKTLLMPHSPPPPITHLLDIELLHRLRGAVDGVLLPAGARAGAEERDGGRRIAQGLEGSWTTKDGSGAAVSQ